jgi:hypothetical protein
VEIAAAHASLKWEIAGTGQARPAHSLVRSSIWSKGVDPARILAMTYTKKAADEMRDQRDVQSEIKCVQL